MQADNTQSIVVVIGNEAKKLVDATLHAVEEGEIENIAPVSAFVAPTPVAAPICAACIGAYALLGAGGIAGAVDCFNYL